MKKSTPSIVKQMNRDLIINELRKRPNQSRADLSKITKLSKPTVSELVKELIDEGLIIETGVGPSSGGKKPINLVYNARFTYVIGIFIENNTIYCALGDMNGEIVNLQEKKFTLLTDGEIIIDYIVGSIMNLLDTESIGMDKVLGIVLGVSGIKIDSDDLISFSPTIKWGNINIKKELSIRLNKEVIVENDVNLMTIGEFYKGQGKNKSNFVYLFIGNGIGSGLFLDGKLLKGHHSASGEIGYMMIGGEKDLKPDLGVFEKNFGLFGIKEKLIRKRIISEDYKVDSILKILQQRSNSDVSKFLDEIIYHWAKATINIISVVDPEVVIVSGELMHLDEKSLKKFKDYIERYVPKMPEIKVTELGSEAGIYGAVHLALESFETPALNNK